MDANRYKEGGKVDTEKQPSDKNSSRRKYECSQNNNVQSKCCLSSPVRWENDSSENAQKCYRCNLCLIVNVD
jgi:hypothetical protein